MSTAEVGGQLWHESSSDESEAVSHSQLPNLAPKSKRTVREGSSPGRVR
jgi:hypothetical protein